MEKAIKVLEVVPSLYVANGVASFVMNYLNGLDHERVKVDIAAYKDGPSVYYSRVTELGGKVYFLPSIKNPIKHLQVCHRILSEGNYDVIHDNTLHISIPLMWCAKRLNVPVRILHSHNAKLGETKAKEIRNAIFKPMLKSFATNYLACSQVAGQMMFGSKHFDILPNVISVEKFVYNEELRSVIRSKMDAQNKLVVGTVGRIAPQKNPLFALEVFESFLKGHPNAAYWWVGDGPLADQVKTYIKDKGLTDHVKLLGSRSNTVEFYQGMDVFLLPSLFEGLPVTGVEAQAMGLPCVVSDNVTNEMAYTDLVDFVSLDESPRVWADHLNAVCHKKQCRSEYSKILKNSDYSDETCGEKMEKMYMSCIEKVGYR